MEILKSEVIENSINLSRNYDGVDCFKGGLAVAILNDKYGVIDKEGREVIEPKYD